MKSTLVAAALVIVLAGSRAPRAVAQTVVPEVDLEATVSAGDDGMPSQVRGRMKIRGWRVADEGCFYLPYEDESYGEERGTKRRFETFSARGEVLHFGGGELAMRVAEPARISRIAPAQVARVALPADWSDASELIIDFEAKVPRLPNMDPDDWFYEGFLPQPLRNCPATGLDPEYYRTPIAARYRGRVTYPSGWQYVGPGFGATATSPAVSFDQTARSLAFALGRGLEHASMQVGPTPVDVYFHSADFAAMATSVERLLPALVAQLGPFPYGSLKILETSELQTHGLPGVIAINRPAQAAFSQAQSDWLHWRQWILAVQLARQWYGGAIAPASPDDEWLVTAIADFATLQALAGDAKDFNLFGAADDGSRLISFDYLQFAEISAAMLMNKAPFAGLTNPDLTSRDPAAKQHPLLFMKHVFAMRQLQAAAGVDAYRAFLRGLTANHLGGFLTPRDFVAQMAREPAAFAKEDRLRLEATLADWWTSQGWPNFGLSQFDVEPAGPGRFKVRLAASQAGPVDFRPLFGLYFAAGEPVFVRAEPVKADGLWTASVEVAAEPTRAVVDPTREAFDADRFDNASDWPGLKFFPGTANSLSDEDYTVGWFPYAFRRPGEPFSLGLQVALLKYVQSGLFVRVETAPSEEVGAVEARHTFQMPAHALNGLLAFKQNYDHEREGEASLTRFPLSDVGPQVGLGVKVRHKEQVGVEETEHQTVGLGLIIKPVAKSRVCGYQFEGEIERAPEALAEGFSYERKSGIGSVDCNLTKRINLAFRGFAGALFAEGEPPPQALFKPTDLKEARLRLDIRGLERVRKLSALGADLHFPFYVPIPSDAMLLARQMRWRLFYDFGHSYDADLDYRSHGVGFTLPFGGDLAGAGSLSFTRLSVLAILESRVDDEVRRRPGFVFDVTGEL